MKTFVKKITLLVLAGFILLHPNKPRLNNNYFDNHTVSLCSMDESIDDEHTAY